jgi:hypothetical protein
MWQPSSPTAKKKKINNNVATLLKISPEVLQYPVQLLHRDSVPLEHHHRVLEFFRGLLIPLAYAT